MYICTKKQKKAKNTKEQDKLCALLPADWGQPERLGEQKEVKYTTGSLWWPCGIKSFVYSQVLSHVTAWWLIWEYTLRSVLCRLLTHSSVSEAFAVDNSRSGLVIFRLANPHLLESGEWGQDRATDPHWVLPLRRRDDLYSQKHKIRTRIQK